MNKVAEHFKANLTIYLLVITTIVIVCIILFRKPENITKNEYDTSMFNVVDIDGANKLFSSNQDQLLFIGRSTCGACQEFVKSLQTAMSKDDFYVSYLDIESIDTSSPIYAEFLKKLDYEYTYSDKTGPFSSFMGSTPMIIIIKDNKMVFGILGSMSSSAILSIISQYDI